MNDIKLDKVGYWTELKLGILQEYANAYARILNKQPAISHYSYIDAFAGAGEHISKASGEKIEGSPIRALSIDPKFSHYYFIDMDEQRADRLRQIANGKKNVTVYEGDCNSILLNKVFPQCRYDDYRRALCLLDPYGLNPNWEVVQTAGRMRSIEIFLNFMIMDANMNILWKNPDLVSVTQAQRMDLFWGDSSWRQSAYLKQPGLFGDMEEKASNETVVMAYRKRLMDLAGFKYVPEPMPMRNKKGAVIYYLFFASQNAAGERIARSVFKKYQNRGLSNGY